MQEFNVTGMSCAACSARVEKAVGILEGVSSCSVNLLTNSMIVESELADEDIIDAVVAAGYGASVKSEDNLTASGVENFEKSLDEESSLLGRRLIISLVILLPLMYVSMGHMMAGWPVPSFMDSDYIMIGLYEMILAGAVAVVNRKFFTNGIKGIINKSPNMDTLVALGAGAAYIYSAVTLAGLIVNRGGYANIHEAGDFYFESTAMILTLVTVGKLLEAKSKGRTTNALRGLMKLSPQTITLVIKNEEKVVPISKVKVGDHFMVKPGEGIPVDGIVIKGEGYTDESSLTGESIPIRKSENTPVMSGTFVKEGKLECEATRVGKDTTLSQIVKMVTDAAATKAPIARIADRVAGIFVPCVVAIALITFAVWLMTGADIGYALSRAICVLVVSCPCAMGLATPVAIMVGTGIGAGHGILFKNAAALEQAGHAEIVMLDKTGTITKGCADVGVSDEIREDSIEAVGELKHLGLKVVMLTGDNETTARTIGKTVGIDDVVYSLLPQDKEVKVREMQKIATVVMVGDGINDAPALTRADIGCAIGAGTDIAIDAADVVLMKSSLKDVATAINISRATIKTIKENLFWAFIYNVLGIPLAAGVFIPLFGWTLSPMICAACMSLSSFCVVMNALRLNLKKF